MKKTSSRSQRGSKGIKGKHVLQICVLLGVCIWLIYQVKYSHDKKKEFYEKDDEKSTVLLSEIEDGVLKLGRKDLLPGYHNQKEKHMDEDEDEEEISHGGEEKEEKKSKVENGNHEDEEKEEEEEVVEEDEEEKNKQGDQEVVEEDEEENKHEEDEIDEQDQSKTGGDTVKDDEFLEEEKESGSNEREKETNRADEIDMTVAEAREEHYKADDASSAVSHDHESRILNTEKLKESSNETAQENNPNSTTSRVEIQKEPDLKLGEAENADFVNKTTTEVKDGDSELSSSEAKSAVTESQGDTVNGNSTVAILEASRFLQNETEIMRDRSQEDGAPPAVFSELQPVVKLEQTRNEFDPNITVSANITNRDFIQDESRNSTSESSLIENISGSNTTEVEENSRFEGDDESAEKESSNVFSTELTEEADNTSESSISQEEMDALTDPQTLPDIRIEGNEEDEEEAIGAERKKL